MSSKNRLGKGIDSLLKTMETPEAVQPSSEPVTSSSEKKGLERIPLTKIRANPDQPRKEFSQKALDELAESIKQQGVLQPILVEPYGEGLFSLVAGERRFRAAERAGLSSIPALVRSFSHAERLEIALIENIQRENLNPIEEAAAFRQMMEELDLNQDEVANRVGKNRSTVANALRLLNLPEALQQKVIHGIISSGHARAILSLENEEQKELLAGEIEKEGISVREAEKRAKEILADQSEASAVKDKAPKGRASFLSPEMIDIEQKMIEKFGTKVSIKGNDNKGKIEIDYLSMDDMERILEILGLM